MVQNLYQKYVTKENTILFLIVAPLCLLGFGFVLEYFVDLVPCPLCIVQRFFFFGIAVVALGAWMSKNIHNKAIGVLTSTLAIVGGAVAARQVWLQHLPQPMESTGCAVSFGSFLDTVLYSLGGRGNCSVVDWTFIGFSIAEWSLLWFVIFFCIGVYLYIHGTK
jgi:protein dithiol:quinone oxidoreductase